MEGLGLGNGRQKDALPPLPRHTDFIFSDDRRRAWIADQSARRFSLFVVVIVCGIMIAAARERPIRVAGPRPVWFCLLALQAAVNIGVTHFRFLPKQKVLPLTVH